LPHDWGLDSTDEEEDEEDESGGAKDAPGMSSSSSWWQSGTTSQWWWDYPQQSSWWQGNLTSQEWWQSWYDDAASWRLGTIRGWLCGELFFFVFYIFERAAFSQAVLVRASLFLPLLNLRSRSLEGKRRSAEENILLPVNSRLHRSHSY